MALYPYFHQKSNDLERKTNCKVFNFRRLNKNAVETDRRPNSNGDIVLQDGDIVGLGTLPGGSLITKITIDVSQGFWTDFTFDIAITTDEGGANLEYLAQDVKAQTSDTLVQVPLPNAANKLPDGTAVPANDALSAYRIGGNAIQKTFYVFAVVKGGAATSTVGVTDLIFEYNRFVTNVGAY